MKDAMESGAHVEHRAHGVHGEEPPMSHALLASSDVGLALLALMRAATAALQLGRRTTGSRCSISFVQGVDGNSCGKR